MKDDAALTLTSVTVVHGDGEDTVTALDEVDLQLTAGEFAAVVGPSGSGKSSLLAVAGGLTVPTSGRVEVGGTDLSDATARQRDAVRRRHIGFVFQSSNLVPALTALDQVRLPLTFERGVEGRDPRSVRVGDVMTPNPTAVDESATTDEAMEVMHQNSCRHLPVLRDGRVVKMVSMRDLMYYDLDQKAEEIRHMRDYIQSAAR